MKLKATLALLFFLMPLTAQAESLEAPAETSPWTVRAGIKILATPSVEVAYRLPDEHWEILLYGASPLTQLSYSSLQIGGRYYFTPEEKDFNFFAMARAGAYVFDGTTTLPNSEGDTVASGGLQYMPDIAVGLGVDWNWTKNFGMTAGLYGGTPTILFPELALKYTF